MTHDKTVSQTVSIIMIALMIVVALFTGTYFHSRHEYEKTVRSIHRDLENYALLVGEHTSNVIGNTDQLLLFLRHTYESGQDVAAVMRFIGHGQQAREAFNQIGIIDAQGMYVASNLEQHERIDLSDREHFKVQRDNDGQGLFISKPLVGRATGKVSVQLTRRLRRPDGGFAGVVVASVNPMYFSQLYEKIDLGEQGTITVVGLDGIVRARRNMDRYTAGQDLAGSHLLAALKEHRAGNYRTRSVIDGVDRFFSYVQLRDYPLVVLIGLGAAEALAEYREATRDHYLFVAGVSGLVVVFSALILLLLSRQRRMFARVVSSQAAAERANRVKNEFLAKVTHEIRTPINAIKGLSDDLLLSPLDAAQQASLATVRDSADHLCDMVDDLLDLAQIEAGRLRLETVDYDLRQLFETAVRILTPLAETKNLSFALDWDDGGFSPVVRGDPARLRQIVFNLAANAIKFTASGEVWLRVRLGRAPDPDRRHLELCVTDTGPGIPGEALDRIFEPFVQADNSVSPRFGGTGLGLAICRQLLEHMGGGLVVTSNLGRGSQFRVDLELDRGDPAAVAKPPEELAPLPALAVLVVDDNPVNRMVAERLLVRLGQAPDLAADGEEALAALARRRYDLVLLDIEMPGQDGFAVLRRLRAGEAGPDNAAVPVIAMTAHSRRTVVAECLEAGLQGLLAKPVALERLHAALAPFAGQAAPAAGDPDPDQPDRSDPVLDCQGALARLDGDAGLLDAVLAAFLAKFDPDQVPLPLPGAAESLEALALFAHTLKGLARTIGADQVARLAEVIEEAAGQGDRDTPARLAGELQAALRRTMAAIRAVRETGDAGEAGPAG